MLFEAAVSNASNASAFTQNLNDMSGSQIPVTRCDGGGCANVVQSSPSSALLQMWDSKAQTLLKAWQAAQDADGTEGSNVVTMYDEYNNAIVADYVQSMSTLQQSFQLEYLVNQMNLYHGQKECEGSSACQQIDSFGSVPKTWYSFNTLGPAASQTSQITAYNKAQKQLTATYASRLNTLFVNALNYTASDTPVSPQQYPQAPASYTVNGRVVTMPNPIDYATQVGAALPAVTYGPARTPLQQLPDVTAGAWTANAVLYQFQGLHDVNTCLKAVAEYNRGPAADQGNPFTIAACPPIFSLEGGEPLNQGYYDGDRLQPYNNWVAPMYEVHYTITLSTGSACVKAAWDNPTCDFPNEPPGPVPTATVTASNGSTPLDVQVQSNPISSGQDVTVTWEPGPLPEPTMRLSGEIQVNLRLCDATEPELTWFLPSPQNAGNAAGLVADQIIYLSCGNWGQVSSGECFPGAHCPLSWSQLAPAPYTYVTSQYYQTANSYPNTTQGYDPVNLLSNNSINYNGTNYQAAIQAMNFEYDTPLQQFSGSGVAFQSYTGSWYFGSVSNDSSTWKYAVAGLPTGNAANSEGAGFNVPVQLAYWDTGKKDDSYGSIIPRQDAQLDVDGFECTGNLCTTADGETYRFSLAADSGYGSEGWASLGVN